MTKTTLYVLNRDYRVHQIIIKVRGKYYYSRVKVARHLITNIPKTTKDFLRTLVANLDRLIKEGKIKEAENLTRKNVYPQGKKKPIICYINSSFVV